MMLQPIQILLRIKQPVRMIDAQTRDFALGQEPQNQIVRQIKDLRAFHAQAPPTH